MSVLERSVTTRELQETLPQLGGPFLLRRCEATLADYHAIVGEDLRVLPGLRLNLSWSWASPLPNPLDCLNVS